MQRLSPFKLFEESAYENGCWLTLQNVRAALFNTVAIYHMWLLKFKFKRSKIKLKIRSLKSLVPKAK